MKTALCDARHAAVAPDVYRKGLHVGISAVLIVVYVAAR